MASMASRCQSGSLPILSDEATAVLVDKDRSEIARWSCVQPRPLDLPVDVCAHELERASRSSSHVTGGREPSSPCFLKEVDPVEERALVQPVRNRVKLTVDRPVQNGRPGEIVERAPTVHPLAEGLNQSVADKGAERLASDLDDVRRLAGRKQRDEVIACTRPIP